MSDFELVEKSLGSDSRGFSAFNEILRRYENQVFRFALKYLRNEELAEEISQEVFLKVYGRLESLRDPYQLKSWIMRIASNSCHNLHKKKQRQKELHEQVQQELGRDEGRQEASHSERDRQLELLTSCIAELKEMDRDIVSLHYFSDLSIKEVSVQLEMGESAVKMRLSRAREKIQKKMEKKL